MERLLFRHLSLVILLSLALRHSSFFANPAEMALKPN